MTDLALTLAAREDAPFAADLLLRDGALATDAGLRGAILISLFSDARAPDGAALPEAGTDRRGWWGDDFPARPRQAGDAGAAIGSTLWLLRRAKITPEAIEQARQAAHAALAWLVRDGVAAALAVEAAARGHWLTIGVTLDRPAGPSRQRYDFTWNASTGELA